MIIYLDLVLICKKNYFFYEALDYNPVNHIGFTLMEYDQVRGGADSAPLIQRLYRLSNHDEIW